jgi:integrase/recombinase XerD
MTPLRAKVEADLRLRNLALGTQRLYIRNIACFAAWFGRSPDRLGTVEVRAWLLHLAERGLAPATLVTHHAALLFLYVQSLGRPEVMATIPRPRVPRTPPGVPLTREEVAPLLAAARDPQLYTFLATLLDAGLRVSEACHLQVGDIDSLAGLLHVRRGKGARPRAVRLGDRHLRLLRRYWAVARPPGPWLFPARRMVAPGRFDLRNPWADKPVTPDSVRDRLHRAALRAGLARRVTPHDLRRTYATWLLEAGTDLAVVQVLLGHASPDTTSRYAQVRPDLIRRTPSPLDML